MSAAINVAEIQLKRLNERALRTGEPCTCEYVTLLQSFQRGTLSTYLLGHSSNLLAYLFFVRVI